MTLNKEESFDMAPTTFVRGSKLRKSFRIRHRYNSKLPPAAVLFMKSLEHNKVTKFDTIRGKSIFYTTAANLKKDEEETAEEIFDPLVDEEEHLIKKSPILRRRTSFKKLSGKKKLKFNEFINFFKK